MALPAYESFTYEDVAELTPFSDNDSLGDSEKWTVFDGVIEVTNTGSDAGVTDDFDGEPRPNGAFDIGADEIPPTPRVLTWQEVDPQ